MNGTGFSVKRLACSAALSFVILSGVAGSLLWIGNSGFLTAWDSLSRIIEAVFVESLVVAILAAVVCGSRAAVGRARERKDLDDQTEQRTAMGRLTCFWRRACGVLLSLAVAAAGFEFFIRVSIASGEVSQLNVAAVLRNTWIVAISFAVLAGVFAFVFWIEKRRLIRHQDKRPRDLSLHN